MSPSSRRTLRRRRIARGWSQERLAGKAGITRQSYAAIESGRSMPSTDVALRLARALGSTVEALFPLPEASPPSLRAVDPELPLPGLFRSGPRRVRLARVRGRLVAFPLGIGGTHAHVPADGSAREEEPARDRATFDSPRVETHPETPTGPPGGLVVEPFPDRRASPDLVLAGCDPALGLVVARLRDQWDLDALWIPAGSRAGLRALGAGTVHVAGVHLLDPTSGEYNHPWIRRLVSVPTVRVSFTSWEQSLVISAGNPLGLDGIRDLARPGVRLVNREPGSGSRALLERCLREAGIGENQISGFADTTALAHDQVAAAVAAGLADVGVAISSVASAWGLHTVPLAREPFDLVLPEALLDLPAVDALLQVLRDPRLHGQVEALGGYDASRMGRVA